MKRTRIFTLAMLAFVLVGVQNVFAQRTSDMSVTVTANNIGVFSCTTTQAGYDFGDVDSDGNTNGTSTGARLGSDDGATFTAASAIDWNCKSAPSSTVAIALNSAAADHTVGSVDDNRLEIGIPSNPGGGTSTGYQAFTSTNNLVTGMSVGNGAANDVDGVIDLRLTVMDTDPIESNTWIVRLRATGSP